MSSADGVVVGAAPPPEGVTPNFENPEWIGYRLVIVSVVFPVLSLCFLIPRLYAAGFILRKWHTDDCEVFYRSLVLTFLLTPLGSPDLCRFRTFCHPEVTPTWILTLVHCLGVCLGKFHNLHHP